MTNDEKKAAILQFLTSLSGPKSARTDSGEVVAHSLKEQREALEWALAELDKAENGGTLKDRIGWYQISRRD